MPNSTINQTAATIAGSLSWIPGALLDIITIENVFEGCVIAAATTVTSFVVSSALRWGSKKLRSKFLK